MNSPEKIENLSIAGENAHSSPRDKLIGGILLDAGLIKSEDVERIAIHSRIQNQRFGDAAVALGLVSPDALQRALAYQFDYPVLQRGATGISGEVVAAFESGHPVLDDLRVLRNQIQLGWLSSRAEGSGNQVVAVMSAGRREGRSFVAANLAVLFSQMGERTLLIDADMRHPRQHTLFGLQTQAGLSAVLAHRAVGIVYRRIEGLRSLSVVGCGGTPPNPVDLLARDAFGHVLEGFSKVFGVIIVDCPSAEYPEAEMIAARARGCVLVAREGVSSFAGLQKLSARIRAAQATVIGSVLMKH